MSKLTIRSLLARNTTYSFQTLKEDLNYVSDIDVILDMIDYLFQEVRSISFNKPHNKNILKCFDYIDIQNIELNEMECSSVLDALHEVQSAIQDKILDRDYSKGSHGNINLDFLSTVNSNIDLILLELDFYGTQSLKEKDIYNFVRYLILEKNYSQYKILFQKFPQFLVVKNKTGQYLFEEIIDEYILNVKDNQDIHKIIYLESVISYFNNHDKFVITDEYRSFLTNKIKTEAEKNKGNDKTSFFLLEVIDNLKSKKVESVPDTFQEKVDYLNYKYDIMTATSSYKSVDLDTCKKRKDYTDQFIITIDDEYANIFDDAISITKDRQGNYLVTLFVAEPSAFISSKSVVDRMAEHKAETLYLRNKTLDMLPKELAAYDASLNQNENHKALAFTYQFSKSFDLIDFTVDRALVNVNQNLTFKRTNEVIENGADSQLLTTIEDLCEFNDKLIDSDILNLKYNNTGRSSFSNLRSHKNLDDNIAYQIIQNISLLTNYFVAKHFDEKDLPFIFRINGINISANLEKEIKQRTENESNFEDVFEIIKNTVTPSIYSVENKGHSGLNLSSYGHVTFPIRSYASLTAQRLVKDFMIDKTTNQMTIVSWYQELERLCPQLNARLDLNAKYKKDYDSSYIKLKKR